MTAEFSPVETPARRWDGCGQALWLFDDPTLQSGTLSIAG